MLIVRKLNSLATCMQTCDCKHDKDFLQFVVNVQSIIEELVEQFQECLRVGRWRLPLCGGGWEVEREHGNLALKHVGEVWVCEVA